MNESCEDNFQDVITELAKPTESSVPDDLLIAYLNKMSRAIDIMLSHNKEHEGLIGQ